MRFLRAFVMLSVVLGGCAVTQAVVRAQGNAQAGKMALEFCCVDDKGNAWDSRDHVGKKILILYFYPSDFAFCCTRQAVRYRDSQLDFSELKVEVVGISGDDVAVHREFKEAHQLTQTLLADSSGTVARVFDVPLRNGGKAMVKGEPFPRTVTTGRETIVIGLDGRIKYHSKEVSPINDAREVLEIVRKLR